MEAHISWNYSTWLNIAFLLLAVVLLIRFVSTGGREMLRMMGGSPRAEHHDHQPAHDHTGMSHQHHSDHDRRANEPDDS